MMMTHLSCSTRLMRHNSVTSSSTNKTTSAIKHLYMMRRTITCTNRSFGCWITELIDRSKMFDGQRPDEDDDCDDKTKEIIRSYRQ